MSKSRHERTCVYSSYDASAVISGSGSGGVVGLAAKSGKDTAGRLYVLSRYEDAVNQFGAEDGLNALARVLFLNGAAQVKAVPVAAEEGYDTAFALLQGEEDISIVVCDSVQLSVQQKLRESVHSASEARRERIAVVQGGGEEDVSQLTARAQALNSERVVLVAPAGKDGAAAAAVAGVIAAERDPAVPLGGAVLQGLDGIERSFDDTELDTLIQGGVTPLEYTLGQVSVVRGVTTRTKSGDASDSTWRELTTIRIVDDVIPTVRNALRSRFRRAKNTEQSRGAIRSQVIMELENKLAREIITGYSGVNVRADEEEPTVCLVEFSFTVAHGLNQIWISAHITV